MAFHKLLDNCKFLSAFRAFKNRTVSAVGGSLPLAIHEPSFLVQNGQIPLAFSCFRPQLGQIIGGILRERPWLVFPADVS